MLQLRAHICRPLLNTVCKKDSLNCASTSSCEHINFIYWSLSLFHCTNIALDWFSCELLSADCCLTQSAEIISWAVHQVSFNSLLLVRVRTSKSHSRVYIMLKLWAHIKLTVSQWLLLFCRIQHSIIYWGHQRSVWFSCELISASCSKTHKKSCSLTQSAEVSHWAVHYVPVHSLVQLSAHSCRLLLVTVHTSK